MRMLILSFFTISSTVIIKWNRILFESGSERTSLHEEETVNLNHKSSKQNFMGNFTIWKMFSPSPVLPVFDHFAETLKIIAGHQFEDESIVAPLSLSLLCASSLEIYKLHHFPGLAQSNEIQSEIWKCTKAEKNCEAGMAQHSTSIVTVDAAAAAAAVASFLCCYRALLFFSTLSCMCYLLSYAQCTQCTSYHNKMSHI